jgi:hypothetical protein
MPPAGGGAAARVGASGLGPANFAAALGTAATVAVAVYAAFNALKSGAEGAVRAVGDFATAVVSASPDPAEFVGTIGKTTKQVGDALLLIAPPLGVFAGVVGQAVESLGGFMKALDGLVGRYAQYSPQLAFAEAQAEMVQTMGDMARAQRVAPDLVKYIQARTEMQQKFEDFKIQAVNQLLPAALKLMAVAEKLLPLVEIMVEGVAALAGALIPDIRDRVRTLEEQGREQAVAEWNPTAAILGTDPRAHGMEVPEI